MKREEIKKAIKNGESVWCLYCNEVYEIKGRNTQTIIDGEIEYFDTSKDLYFRVNLLDIYKTKAEAEHYLHHANVSRTETLPFLTWEEFKDWKELYFTNASGYPMCLTIVNTKLGKKIGFGGANGYFDLQQIWDLTESNFYKAYDECVRLFKGEEV